MLRILLHIGKHKTGTTSVQDSIARHREWLAERGIYYPEAARPEASVMTGHHLLGWSLKGKFGVDAAAPWEALLTELADLNASDISTRTVILSAEGFETMTGDQVGAVFRNLNEFRVEPIVYLRECDEYMVSCYKQRVKTGGSSSFVSFFRMHLPQCDYDCLVNRWRPSDSDTPIHVVQYSDACKDICIAAPILRLAGLKEEELEYFAQNDVRSNSSPDNRTIRCCRVLNRIGDIFRLKACCHRLSRHAQRKTSFLGRVLKLPFSNAPFLNPALRRELQSFLEDKHTSEYFQPYPPTQSDIQHNSRTE